jgi:hypothetical protein
MFFILENMVCLGVVGENKIFGFNHKMKNITEEITKLTDEWYNLIGPRHHKDRCCHWYIETKWSYGLPPKYTAQHYGYIRGNVEVVCSSYEDALVALKAELENAIKEEKESQNYESW